MISCGLFQDLYSDSAARVEEQDVALKITHVIGRSTFGTSNAFGQAWSTGVPASWARMLIAI
jgi:hypothetical protein